MATTGHLRQCWMSLCQHGHCHLHSHMSIASGYQDLNVLILSSYVERNIRIGQVWRNTLLGALWASSNPSFCDLLKYLWCLCIFFCVWHLPFQERLIWVTGYGNKPSTNTRLLFCNRFLGSPVISGLCSARHEEVWVGGLVWFLYFVGLFKLIWFFPCAENQMKGKDENLRNRALQPPYFIFVLKEMWRFELETFEFCVWPHLGMCCLRDLPADCTKPWEATGSIHQAFIKCCWASLLGFLSLTSGCSLSFCQPSPDISEQEVPQSQAMK